MSGNKRRRERSRRQGTSNTRRPTGARKPTGNRRTTMNSTKAKRIVDSYANAEKVLVIVGTPYITKQNRISAVCENYITLNGAIGKAIAEARSRGKESVAEGIVSLLGKPNTQIRICGDGVSKNNKLSQLGSKYKKRKGNKCFVEIELVDVNEGGLYANKGGLYELVH